MNTNTQVRADFLMPLLRIVLHKTVQVLLGKKWPLSNAHV